MTSQAKGDWWAPDPFFQKEPEQLPLTELVMTPPPSNALATDCYPNEGDAWQAMRGYLMAGLKQAKKDVAELASESHAAGSPLALSLDTARKRVTFAEKAVQICEGKLKQLGRS
jgi:hypothetical protein